MTPLRGCLFHPSFKENRYGFNCFICLYSTKRLCVCVCVCVFARVPGFVGESNV